ncbi:MAG: flagellin [Bacteroidota bacterium]
MALVVNTNIAALQAWRNLSLNESNLSKSLERLSSGLRINRAADDAAGLAISESMKAQMRGLNQAVRNAQDGISMVQTAESAMGQIQDMLQRMRELATQAASDGLTDDDRGQIQKEMDQLSQQITYVANTTQYNNKKVISGQFANSISGSEQLRIQVGANETEALNFNIAAMDAATLKVGAGAVTGASAVNDLVLSEITGVGTGIDASTEYRITYASAGGAATVTLQKFDGTSWSDVSSAAFTAGATGVLLGDTTTGVTFTVTFASPAPTVANATVGLTLVASKGIDVTNKTAAASAITTINDAIKKVSDSRAELGAIQNRLEYSIANLQVTSENLQAANSRIRDVDMAAEMANFTKQQILQQAGVAMLAQANTQPQAILQLLR